MSKAKRLARSANYLKFGFWILKLKDIFSSGLVGNDVTVFNCHHSFFQGINYLAIMTD